jgi:hypothetical protein
MAKKLNIKKAVGKATKSVGKAAAPVAKAAVKAAAPVVAPAVKAAEKAAAPVVKAAAPVVAPAVKAAAGATTGAAAAVAVKKPKKSTTKSDDIQKKLDECNKASNMQKTEISNLQYSITATNNDKNNLINEVKTKNTTITNLNQKVESLEKNVATLDKRINAPIKYETFLGSTVVEGYDTNMYGPVNPDTLDININSEYQNVNLSASGLEAASTTLKGLYGKFFSGYKKNENKIQNVLNPQIDYLSTTDLTGIAYSYAAVNQQNKTLESQIEETRDEYSTDFQKSKYINDEIQYTKRVNAFMFFIFYVLIFVLVYAVYENNTFGMDVKMKVILIVVAIFYPYWIGYLSRIIMFLSKYIWALVRGTPYESSS